MWHAGWRLGSLAMPGWGGQATWWLVHRAREGSIVPAAEGPCCPAVGQGSLVVALGVQLGDRLAALSGHCLKAGLSPWFFNLLLCTPELENGLKILRVMAFLGCGQPSP